MDDQLGAKLWSIDMNEPAPRDRAPGFGAVVPFIIVACFLLMRFGRLFWRLVSELGAIGWMIILGGVVIAAAGTVGIFVGVNSYRARRQEPAASEIAVYEKGLTITAPQGHKVIPWTDVTGVQMSRASDSFPGSPVGESGQRHTYRLHECRYVLYLVDKTYLDLRSDERLFKLTDEIKEKVFSRITPETIARFNSGESIPLIDTVTYSQKGLSGTLVRATAHATRNIPVNLAWEDINRLVRTSNALQIKTADGQTIFLPLDEIINRPVFLKILEILSEEDRIPAVTR